MYRFIECLTQEHHYGLLAVATLVCVTGSILTVLITRRLHRTRAKRRPFHAFLAGLIGGTTIWSTHFIAMLAFEPGYPHGFDPIVTAGSLVLAAFGLLGASAVFALSRAPINYLAGGSLFGVTVAAMHYLGMSGYELPGRLVWDVGHVVVSIVLGTLFGAAAYHRIIYPRTRYCWAGGAVLMSMSICVMHFAGMSAFTIEFSPLYEVPQSILSTSSLAIVVFSITAVIFAIGFVGLNIEVDVEREARAKLLKTATFDTLTALPNRLALIQHMDSTTVSMERDKQMRIAILTIDLNRFKEINDLHGHSAGDAVLSHIAHRFSKALVENEFIARSGGDEFVAIKSGFRRIEEVKAFADRLKGAFILPIEFGDLSLFTSGSIGVATSLADGRELDGLLQKSDLAMYRAKAAIDQDICIYNVEMDQKNRERLLLINDLRKATSQNEFELVYQLQNDVASREPSGFEVLLRWNHPQRGRVSPAEFIPLAEETGLIHEIGLWVLRTACFEAARWERPFSVAVNVAPQQLAQSSFLENLSDILLESGLAPSRLELEVTEASIIDDKEYTLKVMHKIKRMGLRIAMDDFGTGYSSLATLQAFPFDKIKIDRSFIQDVHLNKQRAAIVRTTLLLGEALDIPILAEGVEIEKELNFLKDQRCKYVQGFLFGKPKSLDEVRELVTEIKRDRAS